MISFSWPIVGNHSALSFLQKQIIKQSPHHAYLFIGLPSLGKYTTAWFFSQSLLCEGKGSTLPCGSCQSCRAFQTGSHPDILRIEKSKDPSERSLGLEQIVEFQRFLQRSPFFQKYSVLIIDECGRLTLKAVNALLKTLEEPAHRRLMILIASREDALPKTLLSRCQIVRFFPVDYEEIVHHLIARGCKRPEAYVFARLAAGRPGRAIQFSEEEDQFIRHQQYVRDFLELHHMPLAGGLKKMKMIFSTDHSPEELLEAWLEVSRDILLYKLDCKHHILNSFAEDDIAAVSQSLSPAHAVQMITKILNFKSKTDFSLNLSLAGEDLLLTIQNARLSI